MRAEILRLIHDREITARYQPIVDLRTRRILACEALVRGPVGHKLQEPLALFAAAEAAGCLATLEIACLDVALRSAAEAGVDDRLFLNLSPAALLAEIDWPAELARLCKLHRVEPAACVIELTERSLVEDYVKIRSTLSEVRRMGFDFAIDDLGIGYSGLRMWSELRPDFVKIDRYFISGIDSDPVKLEFVRSIVAIGRAVGSYIIAGGVETIQECREVFDLDVDAAQGFLFAKPAFPVASDREVLVLDSKPIAPGMLVRDFVKLLREQTHRDAFPVVDANNEPLGMVWRNSFLLRYSRSLQPELLNKRPVLEIMDVEALADHRLARTHHPGKGPGRDAQQSPQA